MTASPWTGLLKRGEEIVWDGAPDPGGPLPGSARLLRLFGYALGVPVLAILLIGLANLDEMDGALWIWIGFLILGAGAICLLTVWIPSLARRGLARTRYAVTRGHALILQTLGLRRVLRYPVAADAMIDTVPRGRDTADVRFGEARTVMNDPDRPGHQMRIRRDLAFAGLPAAEAHDARRALEQIRRAAGDRALRHRPAAGLGGPSGPGRADPVAGRPEARIVWTDLLSLQTAMGLVFFGFALFWIYMASSMGCRRTRPRCSGSSRSSAFPSRSWDCTC